MRQPFSDWKRAKLRARRKSESDDGDHNLARWWSGKYNLPTNHSLFRNRPLIVHYQEMLEDLFSEKAALEKAVERGELKYSDAMKRLSVIDKALGEKQVSDSLIDEWEADIAAGRTPDLNKGLLGAH